MTTQKPGLTKSEDFAVRIIRLCGYLDTKKAFTLSKQILRAGTSIGANLFESECAISKKDWLNKVYIALKETNETLYWLRLLKKSDLLNKKEFDSIYSDCEEIKKILTSSTKTMTQKLKSTLNSPLSTLNSNS